MAFREIGIMDIWDYVELPSYVERASGLEHISPVCLDIVFCLSAIVPHNREGL